MKIGVFLSELRQHGIELRLGSDGSLVCDAPTGAMTPEISKSISTHKAEIIAFLSPDVEDHWSSLVPIRPQGSRAPFYCFHGVGGNVLNYSTLIRYLDDDQPVYGVQAVGLDGVTPPLESVAAMADHYADEIIRLQPAGIYNLGGGSMGGLLALEVARRFLAGGRQIGVLILFDTIGPNLPLKTKGQATRLSHISAKVANRSPVRLASYILKRAKQQGKSKQRFALCRNHLKSGTTIPLEHRLWFVEQINQRALDKHVLANYDGEIVLVRGDVSSETSAMADPARGWTGVGRRLTIHAIPGCHHTIVEQPELGQILSRYLRELSG